jgi:sigma-B regulation protein RsbU (phosphoserine phosphatase)
MVHGDSLPLGIREGEIFDQIAIPFDAGDVFLFYSDGITDMRNRDGEFFGVDRLAECVRMNRDLAPDALVDAVRRTAVAFAQCEHPTDDLTCVVVKAVEVLQPLARAELDIPSDLNELGHVRAFVRDFCRAIPGGVLDEDDVMALELAANEAASNIIKHAYHGRTDQWIQLEADAFPDRLSIRLHHLGDSFDPRSVPPPALDGSRESGFGLYLIAKCVDDVRHCRDERGRNCIDLVKALKADRGKALPCN